MNAQRILVVGRFRGVKKADVVARLKLNGHTSVTSLGRATLLLAGAGTAAQVEQARAQGVRVAYPDELEALAPLVAPAPPEADEDDGTAPGRPLPRLSSEAQLRWVMSRPYDARSWGLLTTVLKPLKPDALAAAVAQIEDEVCTWPAYERYAPQDWLEAILEDRPEPRLRLVGNLLMPEIVKKHPLAAVQRILAGRAEHLPGVRQIRFSHLSHSQDWLKVLEPGVFAGITELDFMYNSFGVEGLERLLAAISCAEMTVLDLRSNSIGTAGAQLLAGAGLERLAWLNLYKNDIKDDGLTALCAPGALPSLRYLSVEYNNLSSKSGVTLAQAPFARSLVTLKVKYNNLGAKGAAALAAGPLTSLERLDISANEIGDAGLTALARSESLSRLETLNIEGNSARPLITDAGITALAESTGLPALRSLWVQLNEISNVGLERLLTAESRHALKVLSIENNRMNTADLAVLTRDDLPVALEWLRINFQSGDALPFHQHLADARAFASLGRLFIAPPWGLRDDSGTAEALLRNPLLTGLHTLELWDCTLSTAAVKQLVEYPFTGLRKLSMYKGKLTKTHYKLLSHAPWLSQLEEISFSDYPKIQGVSPLKACFAGTLTSFVAY